MSTVPADLSDYSDAELIASVRDGTSSAYGPLYERHVSAAYNLARQLARSSAEADDLVAEAFAKVLDTLRGGKGPDSAFRAYLLTALRHTAYDRTRKDRKLDLTDDLTDAGGAVGEALTVPFSDTAMSGLERSLAAKAFARLPERWQAVLWHTEIEQQSAGEVAPILGLTANGVSALAYRAREGLRQAYLQVHLAEAESNRCRATADRLGAWTRSGLSKRERSQVEAHLDECERCCALAAELADVNGALRVAIAPLVLGGAALAYLSAAGAGKAAGATAATAGAAAASGAGSGAAGAAGAASAGPRQFAGVATSAVAMAAAAAVAIAAGGGTQDIPTAAASPPAQPPAKQPPPAQQPPAPQPPAPQPPAPQPAPDEPAAPAPPPAAPKPPDPPRTSQPAPPQPEAPAPVPADVTADVPAGDIALVPGGPAAQLPITVRNNGGTMSEPVVATLNLPPGVHAERAGGGGGSPVGSRPMRADPARAAAAEQPGTVHCPGGTGRSVTCRTQEGLAPGESVVLLFQLVAAKGAQPGKVTGTVSSGVTISIPPVPVVTENIRLAVQKADAGWPVAATKPHPWRPWEPEAGSWPWHWPWQESLNITVTNTGSTTAPVELTVSPGVRPAATGEFSCTGGQEAPLSCTSTDPLAPDESAHLHVEKAAASTETVEVTATLGHASESTSRELGLWHLPPWLGQHPGMPESPDSGAEPLAPVKPVKPVAPDNPSTGPSDTPPPSRTPEPTRTPPPEDDTTPAAPTTTTPKPTTTEQNRPETTTDSPDKKRGRPDGPPPRGPGHSRGQPR